MKKINGFEDLSLEVTSIEYEREEHTRAILSVLVHFKTTEIDCAINIQTDKYLDMEDILSEIEDILDCILHDECGGKYESFRVMEEGVHVYNLVEIRNEHVVYLEIKIPRNTKMYDTAIMREVSKVLIRTKDEFIKEIDEMYMFEISNFDIVGAINCNELCTRCTELRSCDKRSKLLIDMYVGM